MKSNRERGNQSMKSNREKGNRVRSQTEKRETEYEKGSRV